MRGGGEVVPPRSSDVAGLGLLRPSVRFGHSSNKRRDRRSGLGDSVSRDNDIIPHIAALMWATCYSRLRMSALGQVSTREYTTS